MAEGAASEDSSDARVDVQSQQVSASSDPPVQSKTYSPPPQFCINNNKILGGEIILTVPVQVHGVTRVTEEEESIPNGVTESDTVVELETDLNHITLETSSHDTTDSASSNSDNANGSGRRHSKSSSLPHGVKLCPETLGTGTLENGTMIESMAEEKWVKLEEELRKAHEDLQARDDEVEKLKGIRQLVEDELEDLTSSLFVEAHKMVSEAKMKEIASEKHLRETKMQMDGLQAEVAALKALLITSTPSKPNLGSGNKSGISTIFKKQHKRTPSHSHLVYGRADESDGSKSTADGKPEGIDRDRSEVDPGLHHLFSTWRNEPTLSKNRSDFLKRIYEEDIEPCIKFPNEDLVQRLMVAIEDNSIWVDPLPEKSKTNVPTECALLRVPRLCHYQMRFAFNSDEAFDISQLCRDRVATVCEFLNYLRYIKNGLVKASVDDSYWEIIRLRKQMALAKLGLPISS